MASNPLRDAAMAALEAALDDTRLVVLADVAEQVITDNEELVLADAVTHARVYLLRWMKNHVRHSVDEGDQPQLFGFPTIIAVPQDEDYAYIRAPKALYTELQQGREIRRLNAERASFRLNQYDEALRTVSPIMSGDPSMTLEQALASLADA